MMPHVLEDSGRFDVQLQLLADIGPRCEAAIQDVRAGIERTLTDNQVWSQTSRALVAALEGWSDGEAAQVIAVVKRLVDESQPPDPGDLRRWGAAHKDDAASIRDCVLTVPPDEVSIIRVKSRAGSQKLVFEAIWKLAQTRVILKRFLPEFESAIERELTPHPLSMKHPNIIETHVMRNRLGDEFLVEAYLRDVLDDAWRTQGVVEAANLFSDISNALSFLADRDKVHGDVKPDNIGRSERGYLLLDFGVARDESKFLNIAEATGSLRTRAPELLLSTGHHSKGSDVWALGATVLNAHIGSFPLFDPGETPPRVSDAAARSEFVADLARRAETEWQKRVTSRVAAIGAPLGPIVQQALSFEPDRRPSATELHKRIRETMRGFLRPEGSDTPSPHEELDQLEKHLFRPELDTSLMPQAARLTIRRTLEAHRDNSTLSETDRSRALRMYQAIGE